MDNYYAWLGLHPLVDEQTWRKAIRKHAQAQTLSLEQLQLIQQTFSSPDKKRAYDEALRKAHPQLFEEAKRQLQQARLKKKAEQKQLQKQRRLKRLKQILGILAVPAVCGVVYGLMSTGGGQFHSAFEKVLRQGYPKAMLEEEKRAEISYTTRQAKHEYDYDENKGLINRHFQVWQNGKNPTQHPWRKSLQTIKRYYEENKQFVYAVHWLEKGVLVNYADVWHVNEQKAEKVFELNRDVHSQYIPHYQYQMSLLPDKRHIFPSNMQRNVTKDGHFILFDTNDLKEKQIPNDDRYKRGFILGENDGGKISKQEERWWKMDNVAQRVTVFFDEHNQLKYAQVHPEPEQKSWKSILERFPLGQICVASPERVYHFSDDTNAKMYEIDKRNGTEIRHQELVLKTDPFDQALPNFEAKYLPDCSGAWLVHKCHDDECFIKVNRKNEVFYFDFEKWKLMKVAESPYAFQHAMVFPDGTLWLANTRADGSKLLSPPNAVTQMKRLVQWYE